MKKKKAAKRKEELPLCTFSRLISCGSVGGMLIWHEALAPSWEDSKKRFEEKNPGKKCNPLALDRVSVQQCPSPSPGRKVKLAFVDAWSSNLKDKSMIEN